MAVSYGRTALTGGTLGALDALDGANLNDGDSAIVFSGGKTYFYILIAASGKTVNSPHIIAPVTNAGNKRWELAGIAPNRDQGTQNLVRNGNLLSWSNGDNAVPDGFVSFSAFNTFEKIASSSVSGHLVRITRLNSGSVSVIGAQPVNMNRDIGGEIFTVALKGRRVSGSGTATIAVNWQDNSGVTISSSTLGFSDTSLAKKIGTFTAPAGAHGARFLLNITNLNDVFEIGEIFLMKGQAEYPYQEHILDRALQAIQYQSLSTNYEYRNLRMECGQGEMTHYSVNGSLRKIVTFAKSFTKVLSINLTLYFGDSSPYMRIGGSDNNYGALSSCVLYSASVANNSFHALLRDNINLPFAAGDWVRFHWTVIGVD